VLLDSLSRVGLLDDLVCFALLDVWSREGIKLPFFEALFLILLTFGPRYDVKLPLLDDDLFLLCFT